MRRAARIDANQPLIVAALRLAGRPVELLHMVGRGCPDIAVGHVSGGVVLMEIKDGDKPPSARKLTADEVEFHERWHEQVKARFVVVVETVEQARIAAGVQ